MELVLAIIWIGPVLVSMITMSVAQRRYLHAYRAQHQLSRAEFPIGAEALGDTWAGASRAKINSGYRRAFKEPQADPTLEQLRRRIQLANYLSLAWGLGFWLLMGIILFARDAR